MFGIVDVRRMLCTCCVESNLVAAAVCVAWIPWASIREGTMLTKAVAIAEDQEKRRSSRRLGLFLAYYCGRHTNSLNMR